VIFGLAMLAVSLFLFLRIIWSLRTGTNNWFGMRVDRQSSTTGFWIVNGSDAVLCLVGLSVGVLALFVW
jgi:hypothetical protein